MLAAYKEKIKLFELDIPLRLKKNKVQSQGYLTGKDTLIKSAENPLCSNDCFYRTNSQGLDRGRGWVSEGAS